MRILQGSFSLLANLRRARADEVEDDERDAEGADNGGHHEEADDERNCCA